MNKQVVMLIYNTGIYCLCLHLSQGCWNVLGLLGLQRASTFFLALYFVIFVALSIMFIQEDNGIAYICTRALRLVS